MTTALLLKIGAESSALRGELAKANGMVNQFTGQITKMGGVLAGAFSAAAVAGFVFEVSKLAAEAEGVRNAFDKLPSSVQLMHDLKEATHGTVSELDLMKRAVAFSNFNLSLAELPKLLEFATLRAQQTGQSVDYLVESIVTGLGRKSVLILDNLGLSAAGIAQEVQKTGDFMKAVGNIVDVELTKMGPILENNQTNLERLNASWVNYKVFLGEAANSTGVLGQSVTALTGSLDILASRNLTFWEKLAGLVGGPGGAAMAFAKEYTAQQKKINDEQKKNEQVVREVDRAYVEFNKNIDAYGKAISTHIYKNELLAEFQKRLNAESAHAASLIENEKNLTDQLNSKKEMALSLTGASRAAINLEIKQLEEKIKKLRELGIAQQQADERPRRELKSFTPDPVNAAGALVDPQQITAQIQTSLQNLSAVAVATTPAISTAFIDMSAQVQGAMAGMAMGFGESIGNMLTGVGGLEQLAAAVVGGFGAMAVQLGQTMIQFGVAGIALKKLTMNPYLAVAAGVALVALGKALSNKASSITGGGGSSGGGSRGGSESPSALTKVQYGNRVEVTGEFELRGDTAVALIRNQQRRDDRTLPTKR